MIYLKKVEPSIEIENTEFTGPLVYMNKETGKVVMPASLESGLDGFRILRSDSIYGLKDYECVITKKNHDSVNVSFYPEGKEVKGEYNACFVLELHRDDLYVYNETSQSYEFKDLSSKLIQIGFPYAVANASFFSRELTLENYGTKNKWTIQQYLSSLRAQFGSNAGIDSFWGDLNSKFKFNKNEGYALSIANLKYEDFPEDGIIRLYFPFENKIDFSNEDEVEVVYGNIHSTVGPEIDSNWRVIVVPGTAKKYKIKSTTKDTTYSTNTDLNIFEWNGVYNSYTKITDVSNYEFKPFETYFMQFAGTIVWEPIK